MNRDVSKGIVSDLNIPDILMSCSKFNRQHGFHVIEVLPIG